MLKNSYFTHFIKIALISLVFVLNTQTAHAVEMAVTIDDLPVCGALPPNMPRAGVANQILAALKKHHLENVYGFMNGTTVDSGSYKILQDWVANGQLLGNHTYSHLNLVYVPLPQYLTDIHKNDPLLQKLMVGKNYKYFRYPFLLEGNTQVKRDAVRNDLFKNHYQVAQVTVDFADYEWNAPYARCMKKHNQAAVAWLEQSYLKQALIALKMSRAVSQFLFQRDIKYVLLIHFGPFDAHMLDQLLTAYEKQGVTFIPLPMALADNAYKIDPNLIGLHSYTFLNQIKVSRKLKNPPEINQMYSPPPQEKLDTICR